MRSVFCLTLALALFGVGCGGASRSSEVGTTSAGNAAAAEGEGASSSGQSFSDIEYESPLAEFLGQDINRFEMDEAALIAERREAESLTAACMLAKGFEYTPRDPSEMIYVTGQGDEEFEPGSEQWIAKYGFGISTQRFPQSMVGDLVGMDDSNYFDAGVELVDQNEQYVEGLSEGERNAYYEALHGPMPEFGPEGPDEDFDFEPSGCQWEGFRNGPGGMDENINGFYEAFGDDVQAMHERIESDSRLVAFNTDISACVAARGMTWTNMNDLYEQFEPRLNNLEPGSYSSGDPFEEAGLNQEEMSERELEEFYIQLNQLNPESLAILAAVQADEIALAQAVIECGGGPVNEQIVRNQVRVEYEQAFLDQNAEALAEFAPG